MKIVQINCVYKTGSTGKIVYDLHTAYSEHGMDSYVIYGRGEKCSDPNVYKCALEIPSKARNVISRFDGDLYGKAYFATRQIIKKLEEIKPDIVHLHCINGYFCNIYSLLDHLKKNSIPTVITLHAEFMYTGNCGHALDCMKWTEETGCGNCPQIREATGAYFIDRTKSNWQRMKRAFDGFDKLNIASVSPWLMERAKKSTILKDKNHCCILNGIDTEKLFCYRPDEATKLREHLGLQNKRIALFVTAAFSPFKGSDYILKLADAFPELTFVVVGNQNDIDNCPRNIMPIGRIENQEELSAYYSMADVCLLVSKRETFSMITAESLCCGTPVVGFEAGAPEKIAIPEYSEFVPYGDIDALCGSVCSWMNKSIDKQKISQEAHKKYSKAIMAESYLKVYEALTEEKETLIT